MLKGLLQKKAEVEQRMELLQEEMKAVMVDIEHVIAPKFHDLRKIQAKDFGAVNLTMDGFKIVETVPKKVEWDQQKLNDLFEAIMTAGDKPSNYMRIKLEVPEKLYDGFIPEVKVMFADARTVKPGKPTLKFEEAA